MHSIFRNHYFYEPLYDLILTSDKECHICKIIAAMLTCEAGYKKLKKLWEEFPSERDNKDVNPFKGNAT